MRVGVRAIMSGLWDQGSRGGSALLVLHGVYVYNQEPDREHCFCLFS